MKDYKKAPLTFCMIAFALISQLAWAQEVSTIASTEAQHHLGDTLWVEGNVSQTSLNTQSKGKPAYLNFGDAYPNHHFTLIIWTEQYPEFDAAKIKTYEGKKVKAYGIIKEYRGKPQIVYGPEVRIEVQE